MWSGTARLEQIGQRIGCGSKTYPASDGINACQRAL
jgi:hypothetical protein